SRRRRHTRLSREWSSDVCSSDLLLLPLRHTVMPKLLPLPFGVAVIVPLLPLMLAFQLFCRLWPPLRLMVTTQLLLPLTEKFTLRSEERRVGKESRTRRSPAA